MIPAVDEYNDPSVYLKDRIWEILSFMRIVWRTIRIRSTDIADCVYDFRIYRKEVLCEGLHCFTGNLWPYGDVD
jgi:virulence-associated protein VapD